jgi:hypothetical protein
MITVTGGRGSFGQGPEFLWARHMGSWRPHLSFDWRRRLEEAKVERFSAVKDCAVAAPDCAGTDLSDPRQAGPEEEALQAA